MEKNVAVVAAVDVYLFDGIACGSTVYVQPRCDGLGFQPSRNPSE